MTELLGLSGRRIVVAGAGGGGIGTAVCTMLEAAGAQVVALDNNAERLEQTTNAMAAPDRHVFALCDVREPAQVADALASGSSVLGALHGLAHVAGGIQSTDQWQPTDTVPLELVRQVIELNFEGPLNTSQCFARYLAADGSREGSIVFVSSLAGMLSSPFSASYGAAKAALLSLVRTEAVEWGPRGIRVNAVAPGTIRTPRTLRHGGTADDLQIERDALPLGRRGLPSDIAGAIVFLLSDLASFVSGQVLAVDGGSSVKPSYLDSTGLPVFVRDQALRDRLTGG